MSLTDIILHFWAFIFIIHFDHDFSNSLVDKFIFSNIVEIRVM